MSAKHIYRLIAILLGYGLIISGFFVFGEDLKDNIKILDIIMSCLIFFQFVQFTIFPLVDLNKKAHREVGMMGIHMVAINVCSVLSILLIALGIIYELDFKIQLMGQLGVILFALVGRMCTLHAGEKVEQVYQEEQTKLAGKQLLASYMEDLQEVVVQTQDLDETDRRKIQEIEENIRYINPSKQAQAIEKEHQIREVIALLRNMLLGVRVNRAAVHDEVEHLSRLLEQRQKL